MRLTRSKLVAICLLAALGCGACGERPASNSASNGNGGAQASANANDAAGQPQTQDLPKLDAEIARLEADAVKRPDDRSLRDAVAQAYTRRAAVHYAARRLQEALDDYQSALNFDPSNEEAQMRITQIDQELEPEPKTDDGKPVTVPARPGAQNSNQ